MQGFWQIKMHRKGAFLFVKTKPDLAYRAPPLIFAAGTGEAPGHCSASQGDSGLHDGADTSGRPGFSRHLKNIKKPRKRSVYGALKYGRSPGSIFLPRRSVLLFQNRGMGHIPNDNAILE